MWVCKSHAKLAAALRGMGHQVSASRIPKLLERLHYRRQVNRKTKEGSHHPDRDAQFEHINKQVIALQAAGQPVISVDTKKKELIGAYKNAGSDYRPQRCPDEVNVHDFIDKELGKAIPYGDAIFHSRTRLPLEPPPSAVIISRSAVGYRWQPIVSCQRRMALTANSAVSWSMPTLTQPVSAAIRPAHRNGTGSSTACSVISRRTGAADR